MGFLDKLKKGLNIGGAKIEIMPPGALPKGQPFTLQVKLIAGEMEQNITKVTAKLQMKEQSTSRGMGQQQSTTQTKTITLSQADLEGFTLQPSETKELSFNLQAAVPEDAADQGGVMGGLAKLNKMATRNKQNFLLEVEADIEGSADTRDKLEVTFQ